MVETTHTQQMSRNGCYLTLLTPLECFRKNKCSYHLLPYKLLISCTSLIGASIWLSTYLCNFWIQQVVIGVDNELGLVDGPSSQEVGAISFVSSHFLQVVEVVGSGGQRLVTPLGVELLVVVADFNTDRI